MDGAVGEDTSHKVRQVEDVVVVVTRQHLQQTLQISTIFKLAPQVEQQIVGPL